MLARVLAKITDWALARNASGGYAGEDDKRWAYTIKSSGDYLTRVLLPRVFGVRPMLHHIHRADGDRHMHDHPWRWAFSIILCGSYDEERLDVDTFEQSGIEHRDQRRVRWFNFLTDRDYHRISQLHGEVWTLFVTGPRVQDWGFLVDGAHVLWSKYLGKETP